MRLMTWRALFISPNHLWVLPSLCRARRPRCAHPCELTGLPCFLGLVRWLLALARP